MHFYYKFKFIDYLLEIFCNNDFSPNGMNFNVRLWLSDNELQKNKNALNMLESINCSILSSEKSTG